MAETTDKAGGMLDARKAKAIFVLGVGLWLLMTFWIEGKQASVRQMKSELDQLKSRKEHDLERPVEPRKPTEPDKKAKDYAKLNETYNELTKKYDTEKKKFDEELYPAYQKEEWKWIHEDLPGIEKDGESLSKKAAWAEASMNAWLYWAFVGKFIASVLMLIGLAFTALNGNDWERAAAVVVIGLVLVGMGGALGR